MVEDLEKEQGVVFGEEYDTQQEFTLIDDGRYEGVIDKIEKKTSKAGNKYLNLTLKIRDDVDQKFKKRSLFYVIVKKPEDTKGVYDYTKINRLIMTQKETKDYKTHFLSEGEALIDDIIQYLQGRHLSFEVKTEFDDTTAKDRNVVNDFTFAPSEWDKTHPASPFPF